MPNLIQLPDEGGWGDHNKTSLSARPSSFGSANAAIQHHSHLSSSHSSSSSSSVSAAERHLQERQQLLRHLPPEDREDLIDSKPSKGRQLQPPSHSANRLQHLASSPGVMSPNAREHWTSGSTSHPKPKPTPIAANHRLHGSADAEERRHAGLSFKPKSTLTSTPSHPANRLQHPASSPGVMSPNAREHWTSGSTFYPEPKPTPIASNHQHYGSADAEERRHAGLSLKPKPKPTALNTRHYGSADAAERWSNSANSWKPTPNLRGMSADAAERLSKGSSPQPQLAIAPRGEQNKNNALNQTSNVVKGTAVGAFVAERKLQLPATRKLQLPQSYPPLPLSWADRVERLGVVRRSLNDIRTNAAIGRMTERAWEEHLNRRPDVKEVIPQTPWKDPVTRKTMSFPGGATFS